MDPPPCPKVPLNVNITSASDESVSHPKFTFTVGEEELDDFTLTKQSINILHYMLDSEACNCVESLSSKARPMWQLMEKIVRECFWFVENPLKSKYLLSTYRIIEYDIPLCFDIYGLLLLDLKPNQSFLHVHSGTGYACTIAAFLLGVNGVNHGVEYRKEHRTQAQLNIDRMFRINPGIDREAALPFYHAKLPKDLCEGKSKFDNILVTDCFNDLHDVYKLRRLLAPNGTLVTGVVLRVKHKKIKKMIQKKICMVIVKRDPLHNSDDDWGHAMHRLHYIRRGMFRQILLLIRREERDTVKLLEMGRLRLEDASKSALPPLETLALRICAKQADPIRPLKRNNRYLLRISTRKNLPIISNQLKSLLENFSNFRENFHYLKEENFHEQLDFLTNEFANLIADIEDLGRLLIGEEHFEAWKRCAALQLPLTQGLIVWFLENFFHTVRYLWNEYNFCCYTDVKSIFQTVESPSWDAFVKDSSSIIVSDHLMRAIFRASYLKQVSINRPPWNYHVSYAKNLQRILTKLAARFCADVSYILFITKTMKNLCEVSIGETFWCDAMVTVELQICERLLNHAKFDALHQSSNFTTIESIQSSFSSLAQQIKSLLSGTSVLFDAGQFLPDVQQLIFGLRFIVCSVQRNVIGSGSFRQNIDLSRLPRFRNIDGGGFMDPTLFQAEQTFLMGNGFQERSAVADVNDFLVRRFMSDLKEMLWWSESIYAEGTLIQLEDDEDKFLREVLKAFNFI